MKSFLISVAILIVIFIAILIIARAVSESYYAGITDIIIAVTGE